MEKLKIAILFGGASPEYGVSLQSAYSVITHLDSEKYDPVLLGITPSGEWFHFSGAPEKINDGTWNNPVNCVKAIISPDRKTRGILILDKNNFVKDNIRFIRLDAAMPVLHGKNGEDGTVQGLLELAGIPVVGCKTLASALCMDKNRAHKIAKSVGVSVPGSFTIKNTIKNKTPSDEISSHKTSYDEVSPDETSSHKTSYDKVSPDETSSNTTSYTTTAPYDKTPDLKQAEKLGYPLYVKPVNAGSSYGITKVISENGLPAAVKLAFRYDDEVIIEENIPGFEIGCAVLGNDSLIVGMLDEIELNGAFFDYKEKYTLETSKVHVPARIPAQKTNEAKETAKTIYKALGCTGFARVDMFFTPSGEIVFNEVNTIPGFTPHSRFPNMLKAIGMSFEQIIDTAIELAVGK
jgi:D-alanine---D-serine ligase